jgi:hypothetical protein
MIFDHICWIVCQLHLAVIAIYNRLNHFRSICHVNIVHKHHFVDNVPMFCHHELLRGYNDLDHDKSKWWSFIIVKLLFQAIGILKMIMWSLQQCHFPLRLHSDGLMPFSDYKIQCCWWQFQWYDFLHELIII